jgi:hypothetical protein
VEKAVTVKKGSRQVEAPRKEEPQPERMEITKEAGKQLERLAPHFGREGLIIVGGMIPAHAAAAAGVNPLFAYGTHLACVCLYLLRMWQQGRTPNASDGLAG